MIAASMMSEGTESTRTLEFLAWLEVNKKRLALGASIVVVFCCAVATVQWMKRERERTASAALLELQAKAGAGDRAGGASASDYQQVVAEQAGTRAAARAQLLAAEVLFRQGNYDEARRSFEQAAGLVRDESLLAVAAFGMAASLDALGQTDEAVAAYQQITLKHGTAAVASQARLALAAIYERRGEWSLALRSYSELTNTLGSAWSGEALERSQAVLSLHPELAPVETALPAASPAAPSSTNRPSAE